MEDALDQAYLLMALLERQGAFEITHCQDGDQALHLVDTGSFDLLITDLNLPGSDGFELIRHVGETRPEIPVLAITAYTGPEWEARAVGSGADGVLRKPFTPESLREAVTGVLRPEPLDGGATGPVLAVGARVGDVELGCAGTLLLHVAAGKRVLVLVLDAAPGPPAEAAREVADQLGWRLVLVPRAEGGPGEAAGIGDVIERIVRELAPSVALVPSPRDDDPERREAHRIASGSLAGVPEVLGYQTATTTLDFRPTRFVDVGRTLTTKVEGLVAFRRLSRRELSPAFARAAARYWGRMADYRVVEPFEVLEKEEAP